MIWKVSTAATTYGITLQEAKDHLRIADTSFDTQITDYLQAAAMQMLRMVAVSPGDAVLKAYFKDWSDFEFYIDPIASIDSIKYYDENNSQQTLGTGNYNTFLDGYPKKIEITSEPSLYDRPDAVEVTFTTGYTTTPEDVKHALRLMVKDMFDVPMENYKDIKREQFSLNTQMALSLINRRNEI